jgi:hypothetical protein
MEKKRKRLKACYVQYCLTHRKNILKQEKIKRNIFKIKNKQAKYRCQKNRPWNQEGTLISTI